MSKPSNVSKRQRTDSNAQSNGAPNEADSARRGIIALNKLDYTLDPDLSVCVSRAYKRHNFQRSNYTPGTSGQRGICILNSGADYIDPSTSYLRFKVTNTSLFRASFGRLGSAASCIKNIIITSRSGEELERIESSHILTQMLDHYQHDANWFNTVGQAAGYWPVSEVGNRVNNAEDPIAIAGGYAVNSYSDAGPNFDVDNINSLVGTTGQETFTRPHIVASTAAGLSENDWVGREVCIPLACLSPLFRSYDRLLPSHLMSGARIEITWSETRVALVAQQDGAADGLLSHTIDDPRIVLDSYTLTDSVQRALNEVAATSGLEIPFKSYYHTQQPITSDRLDIEVRKAVSRALSVHTVIVPNETNLKYNVQEIQAMNWDVTSYQTRVGSLYFPQQPITDAKPMNTVGQCYLHTQRAFGKLNQPNAPNRVSLQGYASFGVTNISTSEQALGMCVLSCDLERSTTQKLSGIPVNSSRVVEVNVKFSGTSASITDIHPGSLDSIYGHVAHTFLCYTRLLRVWINSVDVAE